ncbi:MAG: Rossmann-like and DUF2520 domain-containing protein [Candidatus Limnocylindria bacterium]
MTQAAVAIVGAGRVGLSLGRALSHAGHVVTMLTRGKQTVSGGLVSMASWSDALHGADVVMAAVPDDAIGPVADELMRLERITAHHIVLHCSGMHDRSALAALDATGAALGSLHPLMTFIAPAGDPALLDRTPAVLEGDRRAVAAARTLAGSLGMSPVIELDAASKRRYHAGAVFAANYLVVLADVAERLARDAGAGDSAATLYLPLMERALVNIGERGAAASLSGPVARGDVGTVEAHLDVLAGADRELYQALGRAALEIARSKGMEEDVARRMRETLETRD